MKQADTLLHPAWLVPGEPHGVVRAGYSLALRSGRILEVLPRNAAEARYRASEVIELPRHALLPGMINAHTHAAMSLLRGLAHDIPLDQWLKHHIWPAERRHLDRDFVADGVRLAAAEMLCNGITCFNDMYYHPEITAEVARAAGMRCVVGIRVLPPHRVWALEPEDCLEGGLSLHDRWQGDPLVHTSLAAHMPLALNGNTMRSLGIVSRERNLRLHMHVHETVAGIETFRSRHGVRPLQRLQRLGLLGPRLLAVHLVHLEDAELEAVAAAGAHVVHCPRSNLLLASGFCPVARLQAAGVNVALGTDSAASNDNLDLFGEMRTAALLGKGVAGDPTAVPAATALHMATLGGARALGLERETGSLVADKAADCIAVDLGAIAARPCNNVLTQLVYASAGAQVTDVWIQGRRLVRERTLTSMDPEAIAARVQRWAQRIRPHASG